MEIDKDAWYRLTTTGDPHRSLIGTYPYMNGNAGLVSVTDTYDSSSSQQWQLFPIGSTGYMLRTKASGMHGYLTIKSGDGTCEGSTPVISTQTDQLVSWTLGDRHGGAGVLGLKVRGHNCTLDIGASGDVHLKPDDISSPIVLVKMGNIDDPAYSAVATPQVTQVRGTSFSTTSPSISSIASRSPTGISASYSSSSSPSSFPLHPPASPSKQRLSPSAAMGIGIAIGIVSILILLSITLLLYRRRKLRRSQHYRQAKLWKGFEPVTPSTARTTVIENKTADTCFRDLPTPITPAFLPSPPLEGNDEGGGWGGSDRVSWRDVPVVSPGTVGSLSGEMPGK